MIKKYLQKLWMCWSIALLSHNCVAQNVQQCCIMADSFTVQHNWDAALPLYYRAYHFGIDTIQQHATNGIIDTYINLKQFKDGEIFVEHCLEKQQNPVWYRELLIKKLILLTLQQKFEQAAFIIQQRQYGLLFDDSLNWFALQGLFFFLDDDTENGLLFCKKACYANPVQQQQIDSLFLKFGKIKKRYSIKRAGTMSTALAGLGQWYVGKPGDAAKSFILNYSLAALTVYVAWRYGVLNAMVSFSPWNTRYYTGGIGKARQFAWERYNQEKEIIYKSLLMVMKKPAIGIQ